MDLLGTAFRSRIDFQFFYVANLQRRIGGRARAVRSDGSVCDRAWLKVGAAIASLAPSARGRDARVTSMARCPHEVSFQRPFSSTQFARRRSEGRGRLRCGRVRRGHFYAPEGAREFFKDLVLPAPIGLEAGPLCGPCMQVHRCRIATLHQETRSRQGGIRLDS
jgi:hypothetical protein